MIKKDNFSVNIPVPLGTKVYRALNTCGDFCLFQKEKFKELNNVENLCCGNKSICHTQFHSVQELVFTLDNIGLVMDEWGVRIFPTANEAESAGKRIAEKNVAAVKELGLKVNEDGYSVTDRKGQ